MDKKRTISNKSKLVVALLAVIVCVVSVWYGFGKSTPEVNAAGGAGAGKSYLEYIIDRVIGGLQDKFTILEIVPYEGQGEFRYYVGDKEVEEGLEANTALMESYYKSKGCYIVEGTGKWNKTDEWMTMGGTFSNFGYEMRYNSSTGKFEVRSPKLFLDYVLDGYEAYFEDKIDLRTVEANKLTEADIMEADFIVVATGAHDNKTINCYDAYTDSSVTTYNPSEAVDANIYTGTVNADGTSSNMTKVTDRINVTYNTYEKVVAADGKETYVSRDISWANAKLLLDRCINGKEVELSDGSTKTTTVPVILDNQGYDGLNDDGNMLKFQILFRMLTKDQHALILPYISETDATGNSYINSENIPTAVFDVTKAFAADASQEIKKDDIYKVCGAYNSGKYKDNNPPHPNYLTDDYWVYSGDSCLIPTNISNTYYEKNTWNGDLGISQRVGDKVTAVQVMQYLLGVPEKYVIKHDKVKVLEIQPCTVYDYDSYDEVKALAEAMLLAVDGKDEKGNVICEALTKSNYNDPNANTCIYVECMSSSAFNGINTDIVAEYDAVIMGDNDDLLLKDNNGKTVYNDTDLNGYIYLAYGDWMEVKTGISTYYPDDYVKLDVTEGSSVPVDDGTIDLYLKVDKDATYSIGLWDTTSGITFNADMASDGWTYKFTKVKAGLYKINMKVANSYTSAGLSIAVNGTETYKADPEWSGAAGAAVWNKFYAALGKGADFCISFDTGNSTIKMEPLPALDDIEDTDKATYKYIIQNDYRLVTGLNWNPRNVASTAEKPAEVADADWYRFSYVNNASNVYQMNNTLWSPLLYNNLTSGAYYVLENTHTLAQNASSNSALYADKAGNVRLSGNDITQLKTDLLKDFVKAGKLLIQGEELYNYTSHSTTVYPTSNIAEISQYAIDKSANRIEQSKIASMLLYIKNQNPTITFISKPTDVEYDAKGNVNVFNATGTDLPFKFTIQGKPETDYKIEIYIDKNNDGVFDKDSDVTTDMNEQFYTRRWKTNAEGKVDASVTAELSENYSGLISYKVEVVEVDATGTDQPFRAGAVGYTAVKGSETKNIYVLQIMPVTYSGKYIHLDMETDAEFNELLDTAADIINYNIVVTSVYAPEYENWFETIPYDNSTEQKREETNWLAGYDMLVLGFSDLYCGDDISNDNGALTCIEDFIDAGKSVLFTHDTISYAGTVNSMTYEMSGDKMSLIKHSTNVWGTSLSRMFRDTVGMDRYGISSAASESDLRNAPVDKNGNIVYGLQGVSNMLAYRHSIATAGIDISFTSTVPANGKYMLYPYTTGETSDYATLIDTTAVKKLNDGQVTMYPYTVSDNLTVATTHAQWYQLDMEDPSIVVWYTLAGDDDSATNDQYYKDTDKDAGNNYYIYSKGNITYSGAGHSEMNSVEELKLFVNTVIKAITAGNNVPVVHVKESAYSSGISYVYVTPYTDNYEFTFYGEDLDLIPYVGKFESAKVTWKNTTVDINSDGMIDEADYVVANLGDRLTNLSTVTVSIGGTSTYPELNVFGAYANVISQLIDDKVNPLFEIEITDMYGDKGVATVCLVKRDLFNLN